MERVAGARGIERSAVAFGNPVKSRATGEATTPLPALPVTRAARLALTCANTGSLPPPSAVSGAEISGWTVLG
jgi:hypothetical protein